MSIPAYSLLHQACCYRLNCCCFPDLTCPHQRSRFCIRCVVIGSTVAASRISSFLLWPHILNIDPTSIGLIWRGRKITLKKDTGYPFDSVNTVPTMVPVLISEPKEFYVSVEKSQIVYNASWLFLTDALLFELCLFVYNS